ncbi:MAG: type II toxin-antitoxin system HicA family toxin [Spirochaetes bacterium]|nr:type II toxin-antitoxin system HicA family toxin [Spirochaetota bacterium]
MSKLFSSAYILSVLKRNGFEYRSSRGSYHKYCRGSNVVIIPHPKKEIPYGTFLSIVRQSGLKKEDF